LRRKPESLAGLESQVSAGLFVAGTNRNASFMLHNGDAAPEFV
jgi:hypothetical protein